MERCVAGGPRAGRAPWLAHRWVSVAVLACFVHLALAAGPTSAMPLAEPQPPARSLPLEQGWAEHGILASGGVDEVTLTIGLMLGAIFLLVGLRVVHGEINLHRAVVTPDELAGHVLDL